ncbi:MAG: hypothetical protein D6714_03025 [Bacteroidetes bacterium]|nr:MAG: hypothetical protein D6714_03025 [Bacteroidota bacterium]
MQIKQPGTRWYFANMLIVGILFALFVGILILTNRTDSAPRPAADTERAPTPDSVTLFLSRPHTLTGVLNAFDGYDIFLAVKDEASTRLLPALRDTLAHMGGRELAKLGFRESYAGHFRDGRFLEEKRSADAPVQIGNEEVTVFSAGKTAGNFCKIKTGNHTVHRSKRALHVFVYNPANKDVYAFEFDFYKDENPAASGFILNATPLVQNQIELVVSQKNFLKLKKKRDHAVRDGILISSEDDFVRAKVRYEGKLYKAKIRLKGDWTDHLEDNKWSFRVILDSGQTIRGMRKFSLHHPKARNYIGEWIFHELLRRGGLLNLQYDFVNVQMTVRDALGEETMDWGLYAIEEGFDKYLLERNERREGPIVKVEENILWEERLKFVKDGLNLAEIPRQMFFEDDELPVVPFSAGKILADSTMKKAFLLARDAFSAFLHREVPPSRVYDVEQLARFNAVCALLGSSHALNIHNLRAYLNPVTARLEPIGFDANAWQRNYWMPLFFGAENDLEYLRALGHELEEMLSDKYNFDAIYNMPGLKTRLAALENAFPEYHFDREVLRINRANIRNAIFPAHCMNLFFEKLEGNRLEVSVEHFGRFPSEILELRDENNRTFARPAAETIILPKARQTIVFILDENYKKLFVRKKMKRATFDLQKDLEKMRVLYRVAGTSVLKKEKIFGWEARKEAYKASGPFAHAPTFRNFDFLEVDDENKTITCKQGVWRLKTELLIPEGWLFKIYGGTRLDVTYFKAQIISRSPVWFEGTADNPVEIVSGSGSGSGLLVLETADTSVLRHCVFSNLRYPVATGWALTGAVNFYRAPVKISNTVFAQSQSEDALNIIRSWFEMTDVVFRETKSDAFDGDFVRGTIRNASFFAPGNDAIDVSGSTIEVENVEIIRAGDKGLSGGEGSHIAARNVRISDSEIGIASKDNSEITLDSVFLQNNKLGFTAFQKKPEFGPAQIIAQKVILEKNGEPWLIEAGSELRIDGKRVETTTHVKDRMYGNEFGKASH